MLSPDSQLKWSACYFRDAAAPVSQSCPALPSPSPLWNTWIMLPFPFILKLRFSISFSSFAELSLVACPVPSHCFTTTAPLQLSCLILSVYFGSSPPILCLPPSPTSSLFFYVTYSRISFLSFLSPMSERYECSLLPTPQKPYILNKKYQDLCLSLSRPLCFLHFISFLLLLLLPICLRSTQHSGHYLSVNNKS